MSAGPARQLWPVIQALGAALASGPREGGPLAWLRPELIDGLSLGGPADRPHIRVHLAEGGPASLLPRRLDTALGEVALQAWRRPRPLAQCATLQGQRSSPAGDMALGALGFPAVDQYAADRYYLVTAGHVLAAHVEACFDDAFEIRASPEGERIGLAHLAQTSITGGPGVGSYELDAGLLRVCARDWRELMRRVPELVPERLGQTPVRGDPLQLCLPGGERIRGSCAGLCSAMNITVRRIGADGHEFVETIRLDALVAATLDRAPRSGDSGASVRGADDALLGLHSAGLAAEPGEPNAWFTPAVAALDYFRILPVTRDSLSRPATVLPLPALRSALPRTVRSTAPAAGATPAEVEEQRVDTLARTLWAEARGEGQRGMEAVACVVMNRVRRNTWWGKTVEQVCRKPYQFSCWNPGSAALNGLLKVSAADADFGRALAIARRAIRPDWADFTEDACHYHTVDILPGWAAGQTPCFRLGRHVFYNRIR